jgi:hypothetical protein
MTAPSRSDPNAASPPDGVRALVPRERMSPGARKLRDAYACVPGAPFYQEEFGFFCLDRWTREGMPADVPRERCLEFAV